MHFFPVVVGFSIGAVITLAIAGVYGRLAIGQSTRAAAAQARAEAQVEVAKATERSGLQTTQIHSLQSERDAAQHAAKSLEEKLAASNAEAAGLKERANRLPGLEQQIRTAEDEKVQLRRELSDANAKLAAAESGRSAADARITNLGEEILSLSKRRDELTSAQSRLEAQNAGLNTALEAERKQNDEKIALLLKAREDLLATFRDAANEILEQKSQRFTEVNKTNLAQILDPLRAKIQEFESQVRQTYNDESKDRTALGEQVKQLVQLNRQLSDDANNLTKALKGSSKELGNWGELILDQILGSSGLEKGQYLMRPTYTRPDGSSAVPDAVIFLPRGRTLVVDSKASLSAYSDYVGSETETARAAALAQHIAALRKHLIELASREYQHLPGLNAPDFVIMFVPNEAAFIAGVTQDKRLWQEAWSKNVLLVSTTSLLFVIRIVASLWTQEDQRKHFQETARRGGALYDKLVGFIEDLQAVGERLAQAREKYDGAFSKLYTGKWNVIRQAEMLRECGVRPTKDIPRELVELSSETKALPDLSGAASATEASD